MQAMHGNSNEKYALPQYPQMKGSAQKLSLSTIHTLQNFAIAHTDDIDTFFRTSQTNA